MAKEKKDYLASVLVLGIVISLVFAGIVVYVKVNQAVGNTCGLERFTNYQKKELENSTHVLDSENEFLLQGFEINKSGLAYNEFCYDGIVEGSGLEVQVIDQNRTVRGSGFAFNDTTYRCVSFDREGLGQSASLGIRCLNCVADNKLVLRSEILGAEVVQIAGNDTGLALSMGETLRYEILSKLDCRHTLRFFTGLYLVLMFVIGVTALIMFGFEKFKSEVTKEW